MGKLTSDRSHEFTVSKVRHSTLPETDWATLLRAEVRQISLVKVLPGELKTWEIHAERNEWHIALMGNALLAQFSKGGQALTGEQSVMVPALVCHGLYNGGEVPALILIASSQTHTPGEDDWPLKVTQDHQETLHTLWEEYFS